MNKAVLADLHTHTRLCRHADGEPVDFVVRAAQDGIRVLGISDHFPSPAGYDAEYRMRRCEWTDYCDMVKRAKNLGEKLGVEVLFATEYDFVPGRMNEVMDMLEQLQNEGNMRFDYLIGSVHYVDDFAFDDPDKIQEWQIRGADSVWERYLDLLQEFTENYSFSIMAHPDLPKKFGFYHSDPDYIACRYRAIFHTAARKNICVELNTAGLRVPAKEIYPNHLLLKIAAEAGLKITLGSDAHSPDLVGYGFKEACKITTQNGLHKACYFRQGNSVEYDFSEF